MFSQKLVDLKQLSAQSLTKGLVDRELDELAKLCYLEKIPGNTTFIYEGSPPQSVYLIVEGGVRVYVTSPDGKEVTVSFLGPNEILGEIAYLNDTSRSASVQTIKDTKVLIMSGDNFRKIFTGNSTVAVNLLSILAKRIQDTNQQLEVMVASSLLDRTVKVLTILEKYFPQREICLSHEDLATIIGATRPRVTEALHYLKSLGRIELNRHKICLTSTFLKEQT